MKKLDAMEAAKITKAPSVVPVVAPLPPAPPPMLSIVPPPPQAPGKLERYRVTARTTMSLQGQLIVLPVDTIVSAASYGHDGMQSIFDSGVPLEKLED
jgi:hypothetical protein